MPEIKLRDVTKRWGKFYAVDHLDLDIADNSFITLLGPSGCGKTTTLRMIAGLECGTWACWSAWEWSCLWVFWGWLHSLQAGRLP